jgi:general nucleoside transport system permease protein
MSNSSTRIRKQLFQQTLSLISAIVAAILIGLLLLAMDGFNPGAVLSSAYSSTFSSSYRFANTIARLITIVLVALAAAIPFKAGIWNIGGDGQLTVGAFASALVGFSISGLNPVLHITLAVLAGMLGGALWAGISAYLRLKFQANEIVICIMMNYLALLLTEYFVIYPFHAPGSSNAETVLVKTSATLTQLVPMSNLNTGIFIAIFAFIVIYFLDRFTTWGYEWRVLGANEEFARYGGVNDMKMRGLAMMVGGALAGLAGSILVLGVYHKFVANIGSGIGFTGVLIALIAANSPILILFVSMIFSILESSAVGMQSKLGVAVEFNDIIQSIIILMVITRSKLWSVITKFISHRNHNGNIS